MPAGTYQLTQRAVDGAFYHSYEPAFAASWATRLGRYIPTDQVISETHGWLGQVPAPREWRGSRLANVLGEYTYTIRNQEYELTVDIPRKLAQRDRSGQTQQRIEDMGVAFAAHWEYLLYGLIANGTTQTCYDGQYFFDTDHSDGKSGTQVNAISNTQVAAMAVTVAAAPRPDEMAKAILGVIAYMRGYKDEHGNPMNAAANRWAVVAPTPLAGIAAQAIYLPMVSAAAGAVLPNPLYAQRGAPGALEIELITEPRLTWTVDIGVFRIGTNAAAFILQEEEIPTSEVLGEGSDIAVNEGVYRYAMRSNRAAGYGLWQYASKATFSAA